MWRTGRHLRRPEESGSECRWKWRRQYQLEARSCPASDDPHDTCCSRDPCDSVLTSAEGPSRGARALLEARKLINPAFFRQQDRIAELHSSHPWLDLCNQTLACTSHPGRPKRGSFDKGGRSRGGKTSCAAVGWLSWLVRWLLVGWLVCWLLGWLVSGWQREKHRSETGSARGASASMRLKVASHRPRHSAAGHRLFQADCCKQHPGLGVAATTSEVQASLAAPAQRGPQLRKLCKLGAGRSGRHPDQSRIEACCLHSLSCLRQQTGVRRLSGHAGHWQCVHQAPGLEASRLSALLRCCRAKRPWCCRRPCKQHAVGRQCELSPAIGRRARRENGRQR